MDKFVIIYATDITGFQGRRYSGGSWEAVAGPQKIYKDCSSISFMTAPRKEYENLGFPASYTGYVYKELNTMDVFCLERTEGNIKSERVSSDEEIILFNYEQTRNGEAFLREVLNYPFLPSEDLVKTEQIKSWGQFESFQDARGFSRFPKERFAYSEKVIYRVVNALMHERRVFLHLPITTSYESLSLQVLGDIFKLIPPRDRTEIPFTTARKETDKYYFDRFLLILTDEGQLKDVEDSSLHIRLLEQDIVLTSEESIISRWANEEPKAREEISGFPLFKDGAVKTGEKIKHRKLPNDFHILQNVYRPENLWWIEDDCNKRFATYFDVKEEMDNNPALWVSKYRDAFCKKLRFLLNGIEGRSYEDSLTELLLEYLIAERHSGESDSDALQLVMRSDKAIEEQLDYWDQKCGWFGMNDEWQRDFRNEVALLREMMMFKKRA